MSDSLANLSNENLVEGLTGLIREQRISEAISAIDAHEDPAAVGSAFNSIVKKFYREFLDVANMIVAADLGLDYCLRKSALESNPSEIRELKNLGRVIAFNAAANCWPGWGDPGIVIEEAHIEAGISMATESRNLVQELGLEARVQGTAHWLVGALELAAGRLDAARVAFGRAEQLFLTSDALWSQLLMVRGYIALARKADPQSRAEGSGTLNETLECLRAQGSKEAIFFAYQLVTADRVLLREP